MNIITLCTQRRHAFGTGNLTPQNLITRTVLVGMALAMFSLASLPHPARAESPQKVEWKDLLPKLPPLINPLTQLSDDQREQVEKISYLQGFGGAIMDPDMMAEYKEAQMEAVRARINLEKQGVNVDDLFDRYQKWEVEVDRRTRLTRKKYNGKRITIAGYLLPLDFNKGGVKDFLLVPFIGACIHVPPPPINQTIFVHMKKFHSVGVFDPVLVTGRMNAKSVSKKIAESGSTVNAGYTLTGDTLRKYNKKF